MRGRLFGPLSEFGWHVVGMEPNEAFFAHAKAVAGPLRNVEVWRSGFNDVAAVEAFDLIAGREAGFEKVETFGFSAARESKPVGPGRMMIVASKL